MATSRIPRYWLSGPAPGYPGLGSATASRGHRYCFYYRDYQWLKRMWWQGTRARDPADDGGKGAPQASDPSAYRPRVTIYQPGLGHVPTQWTPPNRLDLKPNGKPSNDLGFGGSPRLKSLSKAELEKED